MKKEEEEEIENDRFTANNFRLVLRHSEFFVLFHARVTRRRSRKKLRDCPLCWCAISCMKCSQLWLEEFARKAPNALWCMCHYSSSFLVFYLYPWAPQMTARIWLNHMECDWIWHSTFLCMCTAERVDCVLFSDLFRIQLARYYAKVGQQPCSLFLSTIIQPLQSVWENKTFL